ncbi:energy transducer TonB [Hwangdonia lutea]|uniref:Energy transducer TonB n=1 Tax=Hwangdonia lutea TaxID=3075823 RepID=A0AA97HQ91_9FLAO|nr:energy transducer TonB [Hwangdonia sp. SCSIO 19198]WOD42093.1 energy transducer TonB [Hwangdonia sp. SCSIO 19198]
MSHLKKNHELIRQNEQTVKKSQKHDANLQKNSIIYFQIGLIVCLLGAYGLFEMKFETTIPKEVVMKIDGDQFTEVSVDKFKVYVEPKAESKPKTEKKVLLIKKPIIVDDDYTINKALGIDTPDSAEPVDTDFVPAVTKIDEEVEVDFIKVEQVPIYPGCEKKKTNDDKRKCMSDKLTKLIQKKFNTGVADDLGLSGKQVIRTQFKIDKTGHVTDVKVRGTHPELEKEAQRVINKIPDMTPGKQRDESVSVIYALPIVFKVQN